VQLYTDNIPTLKDADLAQRLLDLNRSIQADWFGDVTLPSYAVVTPDRQRVLASFKGIDNESSEQFTRFLDEGLERWRELQSATDVALSQ